VLLVGVLAGGVEAAESGVAVGRSPARLGDGCWAGSASPREGLAAGQGVSGMRVPPTKPKATIAR
jgi:hypothetical protein